MMRQYHVKEIATGVMKVASNSSKELLNQFPALQDDDIKYIIAYGHALTMPECYEIQGRKPPTESFQIAQSNRLHKQMRLRARASVIDNLLENHTVSYILLDLLSDPDADTELLSKLLLKEMYVGA